MIAESKLSGLAVLNIGAGDMKFNFDSKNPLEVARAQRCVEDMLKRGYILFVEDEGKLKRVKKFLPETCEYVIADGPTATPQGNNDADDDKEPAPKIKAETRSSKTGTTKTVSARTTKATAVPRTAGG